MEAGLLAQAERLRRATSESRSAVFARALRELLRAEERRREIERYVQVHRERPETAQDVDAATRTARDALRHLPWNER